MNVVLEPVPEMGGTTHMAWPVEQPAGPGTVWTVMGRGSQGIVPTSTADVEKRAGLVRGSSRAKCDRVPSTASLVADTNRRFFNCLNGSYKNTFII